MISTKTCSAAGRRWQGRDLRAKKDMANYCFIADYTTGPNHVLQKHAKAQRAVIEQTPGFAENILAAGKDFPWQLFAKQHAA